MFKKGASGNPGGRPRGTSNKATAELRSLAQRLFDAEYWKQTRELIRKNELHPAIHARLLEIASREQGGGTGNGVTVNLGFITAQPGRAPVLIASTTVDDDTDAIQVMRQGEQVLESR